MITAVVIWFCYLIRDIALFLSDWSWNTVENRVPGYHFMELWMEPHRGHYPFSPVAECVWCETLGWTGTLSGTWTEDVQEEYEWSAIEEDHMYNVGHGTMADCPLCMQGIEEALGEWALSHYPTWGDVLSGHGTHVQGCPICRQEAGLPRPWSSAEMVGVVEVVSASEEEVHEKEHGASYDATCWLCVNRRRRMLENHTRSHRSQHNHCPACVAEQTNGHLIVYVPVDNEDTQYWWDWHTATHTSRGTQDESCVFCLGIM